MPTLTNLDTSVSAGPGHFADHDAIHAAVNKLTRLPVSDVNPGLTTDVSGALQAEIDSAGPFGTLLLRPGTYNACLDLEEGMTFGGDNVYFARPAGVNKPVLRSKGAQTAWAAGPSTFVAPKIVGGIAVNGNRGLSGATAALSAVPVLSQPTTSTAAGTIPAGTYGYRIAAMTAQGVGQASGGGYVSPTATGQVLLSWTTVTGATGYAIYRSRVAGEFPESLMLVVSGQTTSTYTDTGSVTPFQGRKPYLGSDASGTSGIQLHGARPYWEDITVTDAAGIGFLCQWNGFDATGLNTTMESRGGNLTVENCGASAVVWDGPHDGEITGSVILRDNALLGTFHNQLVVERGPLVVRSIHTYGDCGWGLRAFDTCEVIGTIEGAVTGMADVQGPEVALDMDIFYPRGTTTTGIRVGNSGYQPGTCRLRVRATRGPKFDQAGMTVLDITNAGSNFWCEGIISTAGSAVPFNTRPSGSAFRVLANGTLTTA